MIKVLFSTLLLSCTIFGNSIGVNYLKSKKNVEYQQKNNVQKFYSDIQLEQTPSGKVIEGKEKVTITFYNDPKPLTKKNEVFDNLPKGIITIKYDRFNEIQNEVIYLGKNEQNSDMYAITKTTLPYDIIFINSEIGKENGFDKVILFGKANLNKPKDVPKVFTTYFSKKI